jgi:TRAP-type uncharacterized transport system fused permease subunit
VNKIRDRQKSMKKISYTSFIFFVFILATLYFFCTVHFVHVNKRPTNASIVIQYNSMFFHSYMLWHLKCHLQGVYYESSDIYAQLLLKSTQWMVDIRYAWCRNIQRTIEWSCSCWATSLISSLYITTPNITYINHPSDRLQQQLGIYLRMLLINSQKMAF